MKNYTKVVAVAIGVVGVYLIYRYFKKASPKKIENIVIPPNNSGVYPLKVGSKGDAVVQLQGFLNMKLPTSVGGETIDVLNPDGIWGSKTQKALVTLSGFSIIKSEEEYKQVLAKIKNYK